MSKEIPFDDDIMTLIMGIAPDEPGQHGRTNMPKPDGDVIGLITEIRDKCDDFLQKFGKECGKPEGKPGKEEEGDEGKGKPAFGDEDAEDKEE